jgi:hypothetical protein
VVRVPDKSKVRTFKFEINIKSETEISDSNVTLVCGEDRQINAHKIVKDKWGFGLVPKSVCEDIEILHHKAKF